MKNKKRTIMIGLDGVPYQLIEKYTRRGIMPEMKKFISENTFFKMNSSIPDVPNVAWSSIITGKNPGEHGIFGFMDVNRKNYQLYFPDFRDIKSVPFWSKFKKAAIINIPSTYPAQPVNGIMVSGFVSIDLEGAVYPKSLLEELKQIGYKVDVNNSLARENQSAFINDLHRTLEIHLKFLESVWMREEWDLIVFIMTSTDRMNLFFWDAFENSSSPFRATFEEYYNTVDKVVGRILNRCETNDNVVILSENGYEKLEMEFYVNRLLKDKGYLAYKNDDPKTPIDLDVTTRAFALDPGRIYINSQERFLFGRVKQTEKERLVNELEMLFRNLQIDRKKIIKEVHRGEKLYKGPYTASAPDLVLVGAEGIELKGKISSEKLTDKRIFNGKHTHENAFLAASKRGGMIGITSPLHVEKVVEFL